eukprot:TRINITY_DN19635_c0_g1_i1.p1 TRINITY_DN19635_c0_g1~~TRINITY_DN19635_c0_g1_i1.p1  ORF type:complete len:446 (+),score=81.89 TRINITY_DN19635_c0_g1_i1:88-1425(+)
MGQCAPYLLTCGYKSLEDSKHPQASRAVSQAFLDRVLGAFHKAGAAAAASTGSQKTREAWEHAYKIADALVRGVHSHIPEAFKHIEFIEGSRCEAKCARLQSRGKGVVACIKVHFWPPEVLGDVATRSRISVQVRLAQELCFALLQPPSDVIKEPLVLEIDGLSFPCLPESRALRKKLKAMLGDDYSIETAFAYFEKHKVTDFLAQDSKLRRIHASLFEVASLVKPPAWVSSKSFFGHLNAPSNVFEALEFWEEGEAGIRVTSRKSPPPDEDERQCVEIGDSIVSDILANPVDRGIAHKFFKSAYNFGCLNTARAKGYQGASPELTAKLLSAARDWGPASSGWQSFDSTWNCTDSKSSLGRVEEQGRLIWITPGAGQIPRTPADRASQVSALLDQAASSQETSSTKEKAAKEAFAFLPPLSLLIIVATVLVVMSWLQSYSTHALQ